jgi:hypothetical protein
MVVAKNVSIKGNANNTSKIGKTSKQTLIISTVFRISSPWPLVAQLHFLFCNMSKYWKPSTTKTMDRMPVIPLIIIIKVPIPPLSSLYLQPVSRLKATITTVKMTLNNKYQCIKSFRQFFAHSHDGTILLSLCNHTKIMSSRTMIGNVINVIMKGTNLGHTDSILISSKIMSVAISA